MCQRSSSRVLAPDFSVAGEIEQITSAESYLVPFDGGTGQQPLGDGVVAHTQCSSSV